MVKTFSVTGFGYTCILRGSGLSKLPIISVSGKFKFFVFKRLLLARSELLYTPFGVAMGVAFQLAGSTAYQFFAATALPNINMFLSSTATPFVVKSAGS